MLMYITGWIRVFKELLRNFGRMKIKGVKYYFGKGVRIWTHHKGICVFKGKCWLSHNTFFEVNGGKLVIGINNFFNSNCRVVSMGHLTVGDNNLFGPNVTIIDHDHNFHGDGLICKQGFNVKDTIIGSNVWLGAGCVVCAGVKISDNVVIGANSVVTKDIIESGVYVGAPARLIGSL